MPNRESLKSKVNFGLVALCGWRVSAARGATQGPTARSSFVTHVRTLTPGRCAGGVHARASGAAGGLHHPRRRTRGSRGIAADNVASTSKLALEVFKVALATPPRGRGTWRRVTMACCGTRSRVDGPEVCTVCLDPLPLPGPGKDCVLVLHACGHAFHRDCAQDFLLCALRKYEKPRCPNCRASLHTAPFGKLLGQRRLPRTKRMRNMRQLITVSEVRPSTFPHFFNRFLPSASFVVSQNLDLE